MSTQSPFFFSFPLKLKDTGRCLRSQKETLIWITSESDHPTWVLNIIFIWVRILKMHYVNFLKWLNWAPHETTDIPQNFQKSHDMLNGDSIRETNHCEFCEVIEVYRTQIRWVRRSHLSMGLGKTSVHIKWFWVQELTLRQILQRLQLQGSLLCECQNEVTPKLRGSSASQKCQINNTMSKRARHKNPPQWRLAINTTPL